MEEILTYYLRIRKIIQRIAKINVVSKMKTIETFFLLNRRRNIDIQIKYKVKSMISRLIRRLDGEVYFDLFNDLR